VSLFNIRYCEHTGEYINIFCSSCQNFWIFLVSERRYWCILTRGEQSLAHERVSGVWYGLNLSWPLPVWYTGTRPRRFSKLTDSIKSHIITNVCTVITTCLICELKHVASCILSVPSNLPYNEWNANRLVRWLPYLLYRFRRHWPRWL